MKSLHRHLIAASLAAAVGVGAIAQVPTPAASAPGGKPDAAQMEQFRARMHERMAKRLGELKQKLQITPAQEPAWNTWTAALRPQPHQRIDRAEMEKLTTPERIDRMRAVRAERNAQMESRMDATKAFYSALGAEQKKVFDAESLRFLSGGKRGFGEHGRGHHMRS